MFFTFFQLETCLVGNLLWMVVQMRMNSFDRFRPAALLSPLAVQAQLSVLVYVESGLWLGGSDVDDDAFWDSEGVGLAGFWCWLRRIQVHSIIESAIAVLRRKEIKRPLLIKHVTREISLRSWWVPLFALKLFNHFFKSLTEFFCTGFSLQFNVCRT